MGIGCTPSESSAACLTHFRDLVLHVCHPGVPLSVSRAAVSSIEPAYRVQFPVSSQASEAAEEGILGPRHLGPPSH